MVSQALAERPLECCGLLAGAEVKPNQESSAPLSAAEVPVAHVVKRYPLVNDVQALRQTFADPKTEYLSDPKSMFEAVRDMRRLGLEILAVYHSHPTTPPLPSRKDLERNYSPQVVNFIISLQTDPPSVRAWWLTASDYREAEWDCSP
jgi:proteasome lid subunit RPN8/RPN11